MVCLVEKTKKVGLKKTKKTSLPVARSPANTQVRSNRRPEIPSFFLLAGIGVVALYFFTHLWNLGKFPVFADESIYIRWAQLCMDDWKRYAFFALNDGKTPLFIWQIATFQWLNPNQLIAARLVSLAAGILQMLIAAAVLRTLNAKKSTQLLGMLLICTLPFWFTYHRLAVMDGWLTVWISFTFWAQLKLGQAGAALNKKLFWSSIVGLGLGLALWTKLPALFYLPVGVWVALWLSWQNKSTYSKQNLIQTCGWQVAGLGLGLIFFAAMRLSPLFGQLFHRGQEFTFSLAELRSGKWQELFPHLSQFTLYFATYLSWPILIAVVTGLFFTRTRQKICLLLGCSILFCLPFMALGKVIYPRYLLPAAFFLTIGGAVAIEAICQNLFSKSGLLIRVFLSMVVALLAGQTVIVISLFMIGLIFAPNVTPFVATDRKEYLEEWSSGHGIAETVEMIRTETKQHSLAVATEGRFGTLPDGLLLFFHDQNVDHLYIEGTGQYPVKTIPDFFKQRARTFDHSWLVVNSHRMELKLPAEKKIAEFCRPNGAPCLQVWDITQQVKQ